MVHKQSVEAEQRRFARKALQHNAFEDRIACETVNLLTSEQLNDLLRANFDFVLSSTADVDRGEILADSLGRGTLQK
jgi:hypothetical protein